MSKMSGLYVLSSLIMAGVFAVVGMLFLFANQSVLNFFNYLSPFFNLPQAIVHERNFYSILAVAYMYTVTFLSVMMARDSGNKAYPTFLANAKFASSLLSLAFLSFHEKYLIYIANFAVDGLICIFTVFLMHINFKKSE